MEKGEYTARTERARTSPGGLEGEKRREETRRRHPTNPEGPGEPKLADYDSDVSHSSGAAHPEGWQATNAPRLGLDKANSSRCVAIYGVRADFTYVHRRLDRKHINTRCRTGPSTHTSPAPAAAPPATRRRRELKKCVPLRGRPLRLYSGDDARSRPPSPGPLLTSACTPQRTQSNYA